MLYKLTCSLTEVLYTYWLQLSYIWLAIMDFGEIGKDKFVNELSSRDSRNRMWYALLDDSGMDWVLTIVGTYVLHKKAELT